MIKPYDLLNGVLHEIENGLKEGVNENALAKIFFLSNIYLRKLFKFAFGLPIGTYIRLRKLSLSIEDLLNTNRKILDIALEYGFDYEQSYIRTFKREFGLTPGELRKTGQIIKITPPLQLFDSNKLADGLLFGLEIVMIPQFHVAGKRHKLPLRDVLDLASFMAKQSDTDLKTLYEGGDSFVGLIRKKDDVVFEYRLGIFMPEGTVVPAGYEMIDFPKSKLGICRVYGKRNSIIHYDVDCRKKLA
jgi:AraC-like DNA-binding protein